MKIDLSGEGDLTVQHRQWLEEIVRDLRLPFTEFIEQLSEPHGRDIDWWVTSIASRNTFASSLFFNCCKLMLARRIIENGVMAQEIVFDSPGLARALNGALATGGCTVRVSAGTATVRKLSLILGMAFRWAAACFSCLSQAIFSRVHAARSEIPQRRDLILIDTFLYSDSLEGAYRDRHYPGLTECLAPGELERVFFVPTYYRVRNYNRLFRQLRRSPANFLIKEDFLRWPDYAFALTQPLRSLRFRVLHCDFRGIDVAPLVNEAIMESFASSGTIEGLLRYRLARRLAERGIQVKLAVDWFENQELDHGSNAGLREFFPETAVVGYQGFVVPRTYLCLFPTRQESELRLIPHKVAVMGRSFVNQPREFCPGIDVVVAPAFRFADAWREYPIEPRTGRLTALVPLPFLQRDSEQILALLGEALAASTRGGKTAWRVLVKPHPTVTTRRINAVLRNLVNQESFEIVSGDIDGLLREADILVSSASSVCVHALACGIPVAVIGNRRGLTQNPIPEWIPDDMWALCYTGEELANALKRLARRDDATLQRYRAMARSLRAGSIEPVTRETVARFLGLDAPAPSSGK